MTPYLSLAIWVPIVAGVAVLAIGRDRDAMTARWTALAGALAGFLVTLPLYMHFDLTTSLGAPGEFGNPRHTAAVDQVFAAAAAAGKPVGALATSVADARALRGQGYRALVYGDSMLFTGALREALGALR